jgi:hypothetical protein
MMAKAIIFGFISIATFIAAAFSQRTSERKYVKNIWWAAFAIGLIFHVMALFQSWNDSQRLELIEYQDVAHYSAAGNKSGSVIGVPMKRTPINNWDKGFMTREDGHPIWKCADGARDACEVVMKRMPTYPFSYYVMALCKREENDPSWKNDARQALLILKKTTALKDHHPDHDRVLTDVRKLLNDG